MLTFEKFSTDAQKIQLTDMSYGFILCSKKSIMGTTLT